MHRDQRRARVSGLGLSFPMRLEKRFHTIRYLRALANPVVDAFQINTKILLRFLANRVEESKTLDIPAVPTIPTVGDHQVVKRPLFRTSARKTNSNHYISAKN